VLGEDGKLIATTHFGRARRPSAKQPAERSKQYVQLHWKYHETDHSVARNDFGAGFGNFLERLQSHTLCISGMAFQDAWNIDLQRLQRCCIHVIAKNRQLIPFCAYYLTDSKGRRFADRKTLYC
jgi:uncharacterized radical SAM superfamily Fe-S cluster-containing enzyme